MSEHTPTPWTYRDVSGAGLEICAPVYKMAGVDLPRGMPEAPIHVFQFTAPQIVQVAAERWVQFEPKGWSEMQEANAAFIVLAVNNHDALVAALEEIIDSNPCKGHLEVPQTKIARAALAQVTRQDLGDQQ